MNGIFITFEGIEGCGKTTQAKLLAEELRIQDCKVLFTREPGGPRISEKIRDILLNKEFTEMHRLTEVFLYMASRSQHTIEWILPALKKGIIVICDRYYDSTYAYQGAAREISYKDIDFINKIATGGLKPDITFVLDLPVEIGLARVQNTVDPSKGIDRLERENIKFHQKVREGYLELAKAEKDRIIVLDGQEKVEIIHRKIMIHISNLLNKLKFKRGKNHEK
ncbi:MAG: dTMP kinase [Candidatus Cloacimonetes bacterium]|nr:dTMP kinase [Candidatus Cloacimonadota bacterium]